MTAWQLTVDCSNPSVMVAFWRRALDYIVKPAPTGFATWNDWYVSVGVPEGELDLTGDGADRIEDPTGAGPGIWFQVVPEPKTVKNRLHLDLLVGGGRAVPLDQRRSRVDEKVADLIELGASVHQVHDDESSEFYAVTLQDPEGNEFCVA
jgi:hypothetical protein